MNILADPPKVVESPADLAAYFEAAAKPRQDWCIGTEHEKFGFDVRTRQALPYAGEAGISAMLEGLAERFGWQLDLEDGQPVALFRGGQSITLEPGGQLELSGAPLPTLHDTCAEVSEHLRQIKTVAAELGVGFVGLGFHPTAALVGMPRVPKRRYGIMADAMSRTGARGLDMMFRTATVQVNLDFESESDMARKFRVALALQPVATAIFANSPFEDGVPNGYLSLRAAVWQDTDPARTGIPSFIFEDGMGYERYTDWALDVPMYFVVRASRYHKVDGATFRDFLAGRLPGLSGERPTLADWETHLTTLFPEVRMKRFLEMRGADAGSWARVCALPALWTGILYDSASLEGAWELVRHWSAEDRARLAAEVPKRALGAAAPPGGPGPTVRALAAEVVKLAEDGLRRRNRVGARGRTEACYLEPLQAILDDGRTPAEELLALYHGRWGGSLEPLFTEFAY
jgi:glutamate--cysteine ligase